MKPSTKTFSPPRRVGHWYLLPRNAVPRSGDICSCASQHWMYTETDMDIAAGYSTARTVTAWDSVSLFKQLDGLYYYRHEKNNFRRDIDAQHEHLSKRSAQH